MSFKPPKEFGERSPYGLSQVRALDGVDSPFLKSITPGVRVYKRGDFREVWNEPPTEQAPGTYVALGSSPADTEWYLGAGGSPFRSLSQRFRPTTARHAKNLTITAVPPRMYLADGTRYVAATVGATQFAPGAPYGFHPPRWMWLTKNDDLNLVEYESLNSLAMTVPVATTASGEAAFYSAPASLSMSHVMTYAGVRHNLLSTQLYSPADLSVLPTIYRRTVDGEYLPAADITSPAPLYDNWCGRPSPVIAGTHVIPVYAGPRGTNYTVGGAGPDSLARPQSPQNVQVPYPYLIQSVNGIVNTIRNIDYLFSGVIGFERPDTGPSLERRAAGVLAAHSIDIMALASNDFYLTHAAITTLGSRAELRMYRGTSLDSMSRIGDIPLADVSTAYRAEFCQPVFANSATGKLGYHARAAPGNTTDDSVLFVTSDRGATWTASFVPWPSAFTGYIFELNSTQLGVIINVDGLVPGETDAVLLTSRDYGLNWVPAGRVAENLNSGFTYLLPVRQDEIPPRPLTVTPMAPWRHDERFQAPIFTP